MIRKSILNRNRKTGKRQYDGNDKVNDNPKKNSSEHHVNVNFIERDTECKNKNYLDKYILNKSRKGKKFIYVKSDINWEIRNEIKLYNNKVSF